MQEKKDCRLCKKEILIEVLDLGLSPLANEFVKDPNVKQNEYPLILMMCENCLNFQLKYMINPDLMFKDYIYKSGTSSLMREHFKNYAKTAEFELENREEYTWKPESNLILEIGSNDGTLLKEFYELGFDIIGVDPAENLNDELKQIIKERKIENFTLISDFFTLELAKKINKEKGQAEIVVANNCLAHLDNLDEIILGVKELLSEDGIFIFEVSYFGNIIETGDFSQLYFEHFNYHMIQSLVEYFKQPQFGMKIYKIEKLDIHGGSLRIFVSKNMKAEDPKEYYEELKTYNFNNIISIMRSFKEKINDIKIKLKEKLLKLKNEGKTITGITASAKSTTLLHYFDIGNEILGYIYDDAVEKVKLYSPGKHIPIKACSDIFVDKPDYIVLLSFNFVEFIKEKYKKYEGEWINPFNLDNK